MVDSQRLDEILLAAGFTPATPSTSGDFAIAANAPAIRPTAAAAARGSRRSGP